MRPPIVLSRADDILRALQDLPAEVILAIVEFELLPIVRPGDADANTTRLASSVRTIGAATATATAA